MSVDLIITIDDVRSTGHCVRGCRQWCEGYGFNFREFIENGLSAEALLNTGDAYAIQVVEYARKKQGQDHGG